MVNIYSLRDSKVGSFMRPFYARSDVFAQREIMMVILGNDTPLAKFSADYDLYNLGQYEEDSAKFTINEQPVFVINCGVLAAQSLDAIKAKQEEKKNAEG